MLKLYKKKKKKIVAYLILKFGKLCVMSAVPLFGYHTCPYLDIPRMTVSSGSGCEVLKKTEEHVWFLYILVSLDITLYAQIRA